MDSSFDLWKMLTTLDASIIYLISIFRAILFIIGFIWVLYAIANLYTATVDGRGAKFLPTQAQATVSGSFIQFFIAFVLLTLVYNFTPATLVGAALNDNMSNIQLYSVKSYSATMTNNEFQEVLKRLLNSVFAGIGFIAIYRGLSTWNAKVQGLSNERGGKVVTWLILGGMCFFPSALNELLISFMGVDMFGWLTGNAK